ncbi:MAG: hypothetical protein CMM50_04195 [Rhodospirillaceae bacterium]|nr:hypothetical protein [Rhodospirillaceae bacterium]
MLGFSFGKLLVLAAIILVVWYGFKMVGRLDRQRRDEVKAASRDTVRKPRKSAEPAAEDMIKCRVCGTYVSAGPDTRSCGRSDCPYPG